MKPSRKITWLSGFAVALGAAVLLITGIGSFGMWEPFETSRVDRALSFVEQKKEQKSTSVFTAKRSSESTKQSSGKPKQVRVYPPFGDLEERLVAASVLGAGESGGIEKTARLPIAVFAIIAVVILFVFVAIVSDWSLATLAAAALLFSPVFLFHSRQVSSGLPVLLGEVMAVAGLSLASLHRRTWAVAAGVVLGILGLAVGTMESGVLVGLAAPLGTVAAALTMSLGALRSGEGGEKDHSKRVTLAIGCGIAAVLAACGYFSVALLGANDIAWVTGGLALKLNKTSFDYPLQQLAYGWFPMSALAACAFLGFFTKEPAGSDVTVPPYLRNLVVAGVAVGYFSQSITVSLSGVAPLFLAVPMSLAVAIVIVDTVTGRIPPLVVCLVAGIVFAVLARDFLNEPSALLTGYAWHKLKAPKDFSFGYREAAFVAPFVAFVAALGIAAYFSAEKKRPLYVGLAIGLFVLSGGAFSGYVTLRLVPTLSREFSSKHALDSFSEFRAGNEPLGLFGPAKFVKDGQPLDTKKDVVDFLDTDERVFVLFPPRDFQDINNAVRKKTGKHMIILDSKSDRFYLGTSKLLGRETNNNPLMLWISNAPFEMGNALDVNFDDKITLLGYDIKSADGTRDWVPGEDVYVTTYWRCDAHVGTNYRIFMHIDGPGGRINGDHDPVRKHYGTRNWSEGDYIKDVHKLKVPLYQKKGKYSIKLGMFNGSGRLRIKDYPKARENAVPLNRVEVR